MGRNLERLKRRHLSTRASKLPQIRPPQGIRPLPQYSPTTSSRHVNNIPTTRICAKLTFFRFFLASSSAPASSRPKGSDSAVYECTDANLVQSVTALLVKAKSSAHPSATRSTATFEPPAYIAPINPPCLSVLSKTRL
jgi:hypothetical protein